MRRGGEWKHFLRDFRGGVYICVMSLGSLRRDCVSVCIYIRRFPGISGECETRGSNGYG